jgi:hypothetical protein
MLHPSRALIFVALSALATGCFEANPAYTGGGDGGWLRVELGSLTPEGTDKPCENGKVRCLDDCVDLNNDAKNCGACGTSCKAGETCTLGTCGAPVSGCKDGSDDQVFAKGMVGCSGKVRWTERRSLCAAKYRVCRATEWVDRRAGKKPTYNYWTDDELHYGGGETSCYASVSKGKPCYTNEPMRVCAGHHDPLGNLCNWINCGHDSSKPNQYFGGCMKNPTAGSLCCPN